MNQLSKSIYGWQTVLIGFLVTPVFILNAELFQPPQHANFIVPIQFPQYILFHQQHQEQEQPNRHTNNAKNLETLNSRNAILSSNNDLMHNAMLNAEKPVDAMHKMHRIEQLQQKQEPANYGDLFDAKNKNAFFDEDDDGSKNVLRPHGQPGDVFDRWKFIDSAMGISRNEKRLAKSVSFAEHFLSNLAVNNAAVNFSQSTSPTHWFPFDPQGTQYPWVKRARAINIFPQPSYVIVISGPYRLYGAGTESKFPPFIEFFVQRIQKYFSVYKYEDLSRPVLPSQIPFDESTQNAVEATIHVPMQQKEKIN